MWVAVAQAQKVYRCSPEQVKRVTVEQEALLRLLPEDLRVCRSRLREKGAGNVVPLDGREVPLVEEHGVGCLATGIA